MKKLMPVLVSIVLLMPALLLFANPATNTAQSDTAQNVCSSSNVPVSFNSFNAPWYFQGGACTQPPILISSGLNAGDTLQVNGISGSACVRQFPRAGACINDQSQGCSEAGHSNLTYPGVNFFDSYAKIGFYNGQTLIQEVPLTQAQNTITVPQGATSAFAYLRDSDATAYDDNNGAYSLSFTVSINRCGNVQSQQFCANGNQMTPQEVAAALRAGVLKVTFFDQGSKKTAHIVNGVNCSFPASFAAYKMFDPWPNLSTQQLFEATSVTTISRNSSTDLTVNIPNCESQTDLWYGDTPRQLFSGVDYVNPDHLPYSFTGEFTNTSLGLCNASVFQPPQAGAPQVQTLPATNVSSSQANLNGKLVDLGDSNSANVWFEWGRTMSYGKETPHITKTDTNEFTDVIYGLASNTTYHFRAVAQNNGGTVYGDDMVFSTGPVIRQPQVETRPATNTSNTQTTLNGNLFDMGGANSLNVWFQWGISTSYDRETSHQTLTNVGDFNANIFGLTSNTTYHFRAVAQNNEALIYGQDMVFTTGFNPQPLNFNPPQVQTLSATNISSNQATLNGNLINMGNSGSVNVWFQWGTTTSYGNETTHFVQNNTGNFSSTISSLSSNTTYHFRAVAQNNAGTSYGQDMTFFSQSGGGGLNPPQVQTLSATNISSNQATLNGNLSDMGGASSVNVWFQWGTTTSYGNETNHFTQFNTGNFTSTAFGLAPNTTYHYRAVAQNNSGISFGQDMTFFTQSGGGGSNLPQVQTLSATNVSSNQATLNGNLFDFGNSGSVNVWFQWGTTTSYGNETNHFARFNTGNFNSNVFNLSSNTTYHFRAVAQNNAGTSYGQDMTFFSQSGGGGLNPPQVQTLSATNVSTNQATLNGNLFDMGNSGTVNIWFQWGNTTSYGNETTHFVQNFLGNFSNTIFNLSPNVVYHYRAVAQNNSGTSYGQDMTFFTSSGGGGGSNTFSISKMVRPFNGSSSNWFEQITVNPSDRIVFQIQVTSNFNAQDVFVRDFLPNNIIYQNNLRIDGVTDGRDITQGINVGSLSQGQTKTIIFEAQVTQSGNFSSGVTNLINTAIVYNSQAVSSATDTARVIVNKPSPTLVPTGITNNPVVDSFAIPLGIALFAVLAFKSKVISYGRWSESRKFKYDDYLSDKNLSAKIAKIREREF